MLQNIRPLSLTVGRKVISLAAALLLMLAVSLLSETDAHAKSNGVLDVTCVPPSSSSVVYNPPLTNTAMLVSSTQSAQLGPCVSASVPALTSGTFQNAGLPRLRTCFDLLDSGAATTELFVSSVGVAGGWSGRCGRGMTMAVVGWR